MKLFYETCQFGENVNDLESLQVVDEDVWNPQAVDQLQVDWNETFYMKNTPSLQPFCTQLAKGKRE